MHKTKEESVIFKYILICLTPLGYSWKLESLQTKIFTEEISKQSRKYSILADIL